MTPLDRIRFLRKGMNVRRFHTEAPPVGMLNTVGHHSCGVALLLIVLHPNPPKALLTVALMHDLHEAAVGDVPAPAKWGNTMLAETLDVLELNVNMQYALAGPDTLTQDELQWFKGCDALDAMFFCEEQVLAGNSAYREIWERLQSHMATVSLPPLLRDFYTAYEATYA